MALDGKPAGTGHLDASMKAGLAVGASGGLVTFKDLDLWEMEP